MMGASRSLISGRVWSRSIIGAANIPASGIPVTNASKSVTSLTRTLNVCLPRSAPSSQLAYGRIA